MRKHLKFISVLALFIGFILFSKVSGVTSATSVINLSLDNKKDFTYFTIFTEDKVEFTHFILPAKGDKPDRIVVDLKNAIHRLPQYNYRDIPGGTITAIRTSQYQVEPEKITRIVLDLKEAVVYRVVERKKGNETTIAISTKKDVAPFFWAVDPAKLKLKEELPEKINIQKNDEKKFVSKEAVATPDKKISKAEVKYTKVDTKKDQPKSEQKPDEFPVVVEKPPFKETKPSTTPIEMKKEKDKKLVKKGIQVEAETPKPEDVVALPREEKIEETKAEESKAVPVTSVDTAAITQEALERPQPGAGIAERESLVYLNEGRRDPFVPLSQEIDFEFGEIPLPSVENLKLVGTLEDGSGYKALLEDNRGYGYLLKSGDKVKNGYVVNVFENKIFFQIEEYGWSRVISLELPPEY